MALATASGAGDFFKPADHLHSPAIVLEVKRILRDQPHEYEGVKSTRDVGVADIAIFRDSADIAAKKPSIIMKNASITNKILVDDLVTNGWFDERTGESTPAVTVVRKPKRAFVWRNEIAAEAAEAANAWYENREAEVAANLNDVPAFV